METLNKTRARVVAATVFVLLSVPAAAFAQASPTETAITGAADTLGDELIAIGTAVLPIAAAVLALTVGWRFAKKFVKG